MLDEIKSPPVFIQLGRYGDLIQLLPAWMEIYRRTSLKPIVIVSKTYADVLDGVSYVNYVALDVHWYQGMSVAREYAKNTFGALSPFIPQWWNAADPHIEVPRGPTVLQCHGHDWGVDTRKWPNYGVSMWERAGFTQTDMVVLPLVFDKRDSQRERHLVQSWYPSRNRPLVLYNWTGVSSPFPHSSAVGQVLARYSTLFHIVNLGTIRAHRIYDLLGLYDQAAGLITTDTSTLHLAPASTVPTVAFTVDGWCSSVPKGNIVCHLKYSQAAHGIGQVESILSQWAKKGIHELVPA